MSATWSWLWLDLKKESLTSSNSIQFELLKAYKFKPKNDNSDESKKPKITQEKKNVTRRSNLCTVLHFRSTTKSDLFQSQTNLKKKKKKLEPVW